MTTTITTPVQYRVFQRSGTTGSIAITGTYSGGTPTAIEASFNGGAYATIDAAPSGGNYSGTLSGQAQGQGTLTVRWTNNTSDNASVTYIGVGDVFLVGGQSNAVGEMVTNKPYYHPTLKAGLFGNDYAWKELADPTDSNSGQVDSVSSDASVGGSAWLTLATYLMQDQGVPVAFVPCALVGSVISSWQPAANHQDRTTLYGSMNYRGQQTGCKAVLWWQGESDAVNGTSEATYNSNLDTLANAVASDLGVKLIPCKIFNLDQSPWTSDNTNVNNAIAAAWSDNSNVAEGPDFSDLAMSKIGGIHFGNDIAFLIASRWYQSIKLAFSYTQKNKYVQSASNWAATNTTVTFRKNVTSGNLIVVLAAQYGGTALASNSVSDNHSNTYTLIGSVTSYTGDSSLKCAMYYAYNVTGGSVTITVTAGGTPTVMAYEYSGITTSDPLDRQTTANTSTGDTAISSGNTSTTTQADELIVGFATPYLGTLSYPNPGTNFMLREAFPEPTNQEGSYSEDRIVSSTGAYAATFTQESADGYVCKIATFKLAAAVADLGINVSPGNSGMASRIVISS